MDSASGVFVGGRAVRVAVASGEREGTAGAVEVARGVGDGAATALVVVVAGQGVGDGGGVGGAQQTKAQVKPTKITSKRGE